MTLTDYAVVSASGLLVAILVTYGPRWYRQWTNKRQNTPGVVALKTVVAEALADLTVTQREAVELYAIANKSSWRTALEQVQVALSEFTYTQARLKEKLTSGE